MQKHLYYVKISGKKWIDEIIIAAFSEVNAKAIAEEYFEKEIDEIRLCTLEDIDNVNDKRIMHMTHIMTPLEKDRAQKLYGVKSKEGQDA